MLHLFYKANLQFSIVAVLATSTLVEAKPIAEGTEYSCSTVKTERIVGERREEIKLPSTKPFFIRLNKNTLSADYKDGGSNPTQNDSSLVESKIEQDGSKKYDVMRFSKFRNDGQTIVQILKEITGQPTSIVLQTLSKYNSMPAMLVSTAICK